MRLIDADAVVEKITRKANSGQWSEEVVYGMAKALYLVKSAQTIERPHGEWIPCAERLPEKDGKYLVTMKGWESQKLMVTTSIFANSTKEFYPSCLAWMPLPEPYKKEGDAEWPKEKQRL